MRLTPPRRARRRIAGLVMPWMLSRRTLRCRFAPPLPRPLPPFPLPDISPSSDLVSFCGTADRGFSKTVTWRYNRILMGNYILGHGAAVAVGLDGDPWEGWLVLSYPLDLVLRSWLVTTTASRIAGNRANWVTPRTPAPYAIRGKLTGLLQHSTQLNSLTPLMCVKNTL